MPLTFLSALCIKLTDLVARATHEVGTFIIVFTCGKLDFCSLNILVYLPAVLLPIADLGIPPSPGRLRSDYLYNFL